MVLNTYPDGDLQAVLAMPPHLRPFPIVVDADELIREVTYRARRQKEPLLFSLGKFGLARLYATERVRMEGERNLPIYAGADAAIAERVFQQEYLSTIRWVAMPDRAKAGFGAGEEALADLLGGILGLHSADAPTAELALHCAPCFILTGNSNHLHAAGFGDSQTRDALVAAAEKAELELLTLLSEACGEALATGMWDLAGRGMGFLRRSPVRVVLGLLVAAALLSFSVGHRQQLRVAGRKVLDGGGLLFGEILNQHAGLMADLMPSLFKVAAVSESVLVARALARHPEPLSAGQVAAHLGSERGPVLQILRRYPAFQFWTGQGWTLGYHLDLPAITE